MASDCTLEPTINKVWFEGVNWSNGIQQFLDQGIHIYNLIHVDSQNALNCIEDILNRTVNWVKGHTKYDPMSSITNNGCHLGTVMRPSEAFYKNHALGKKNTQFTDILREIVHNEAISTLCIALTKVIYNSLNKLYHSQTSSSFTCLILSPSISSITITRYSKQDIDFGISPIWTGLANAFPYPCLPPRTITRQHFNTTLIKIN